MPVKKENIIKKGSKVKVDYVGTLEDGTVFDASKKHGKLLEFEAGSGQVIKGFDDAVLGMNLDEEKEITLQPEEAYGSAKPELKKEVPRDQLPKDQEPKAGMILLIGLPNGQQLPARIIAVTKEKVTLDLNHPLAGKVLKFKIIVKEIAA